MNSLSTLRRLPVSGWIGAAIVALVVLTALVSLVWTPYNPVHAVPADRLLGSMPEHLMGTDRYGRDVFSRILAGSRITLFVGVVAVGISLVVGVPLGIWAGMRRGWTETLIMRGADIMLAFPALLLAIVAGAVFGPSTLTAMIAIGIAGIPGFARVARAGTLQVMTQDYIASAKVSQVPGLVVAWRHVLPNIGAVIIVQASVAFALAILADMRRACADALDTVGSSPEAAWAGYVQRLVDLDLGALSATLAEFVTDEISGTVRDAQARTLAGVEELLDAVRSAGIVRADIDALELILTIGLITRPLPDAIRAATPHLVPRLVSIVLAGMRPA